MSCSSKRNSDIGSCNSTLVSSTKSFFGPVDLRGLLVVRGLAIVALSGVDCEGAPSAALACTAGVRGLSSAGKGALVLAELVAVRFAVALTAGWWVKDFSSSRAAFFAGGGGSGMRTIMHE